MSIQTTPAPAAWWPNTDDPLETALALHEAGLCVIPLHGKRPALKFWKRFQFERPRPWDLKRWAKEGQMRNIGVVCGAVSNNLIALDFDGLGAFSAFAALFTPLAQSLTIATGSGKGQHVYLYVDDIPPTTRALDTPLGHIELRAAGTYVAAPPSLHPETGKRYVVQENAPILRVPDLDKLVKWIEAFKKTEKRPSWKPPLQSPPTNGNVNPALIEAIAEELRRGRHRERREWINCSCVFPERHKHGDKNPSFGFNIESGYGYCYRCGTLLAKDIAEKLGIDPADHGGIIVRPEVDRPEIARPTLTKPEPVQVVNQPPATQVQMAGPPSPPDDRPPTLDELQLPRWLRAYVDWSSQVGNQTPQSFHLGMGIWMASVAIARRVYTDARWGVRIFPNLYMMFVADTTFYRKTTAYKLGERILTASIPHMLMPTPGSPERFQDALAGHAPGNFNQLPKAHQTIVLDAMKFAAQRGLFKDEIAGLFGSFKRDYMSGLKDFIMEVYDCPDFLSKETQSGLAIIRNAGPSILGVTTPAGLSHAITTADWDNGLLPRFAVLTPEPDYGERPGLDHAVAPPAEVIAGLERLYKALPMPEKSGDGWASAKALKMDVESWKACEDYSNRLRHQCDPRRDTPLDDRLKGVYGRLHVQAMKVAMICATLDWLDEGQKGSLAVTERHWQLGQSIAERWRHSAHRLLDQLDRSGTARHEFRIQEKILGAVREAGPSGVKLHTVYKNHNLQAAVARQTAKDLVSAGSIVEIRIGRAEGYVAAEYVAN